MRNLLVIIVVSIFIGCIMSCNSKPQGGQTEKLTGIRGPDWSKTDPLAFLEFLKKHPRSYCVIEGGDPPKGWIKEEHIERLISLIDSRETCAGVAAGDSSLFPSSSSTVGNEAFYLISGFRWGRYPTVLNSVDFPSSPDDRDKMRKWWNERKKR